ncbi:MAG: hypothetical protein PF508_12855 [Spirochaeta sp.]|jgi:hypothetical protein|nr:hypothetical protein [Spirochaeta sp.]
MAKFWTKPRIVFCTWGIVELIGWVWTHFWQAPGINWVWLVLTVIGLIPMFMYMSFKVPKLRKILLLWIIVVGFGMIASFGSFGWPGFGWLSPIRLGAFWLVIMGIGFLLNALWWTPTTFVAGGILQLIAGVATWTVPTLVTYQFLVAAVVGSGAMFLLMVKKGPK